MFVNQASTTRDLLRESFEDMPLVEVRGRRFVINPLTEQVPATAPELLMDAAWRIVAAGNGNFTPQCKVVGEEDKGGVLVAAVSIITGRPFGLARWCPSGVPGQVSVPFESEYADGQIYLNGVEAGDEVVIVDDLVSTGGTMIALIEAIETVGARINDIICIAEKIEYGGIERIKAETGHTAKCLLQLSISGETCRVL